MGAFDSMGAGAAAGDKQQADIAQENRRIQIEAAKADEERRKNWNAEVESKKAVDWTKKQADIKRADELKQQEFNNRKTVAEYNDQKEKDRLARERQAKIDAQNTQKFNQDSEWDTELRRREAEQKDQAIAKARLEQEKYTMAFQEEKTQAENRKQALQTGIGSVLSTMEMNGGVIPVSAIKIFNQQHGNEGLELTGGFMSTDGSGGAVMQFKGPDGKPVDNFIPSDKIAAIREQMFGKSSSVTRPSSSGAYAKEALGLKQESVEVRALQGTLGSISRQMEKIQIAMNDPLLSGDQKKSLKEQYEDREMAYEHYNSQLAERVGVIPYAKKAADGTADPAKEKVARPFAKLNGEKPASAAQAPSDTNKADPRIGGEFNSQAFVDQSGNKVYRGSNYGKRPDGTDKTSGFFGELPMKGGGVATEWGMGVEFDGKEVEIPTLVPTLSPEEVKLMIDDLIPNRKPLPDSIVRKAVEFAKSRKADGKPYFYQEGEDLSQYQPKTTSFKADPSKKVEDAGFTKVIHPNGTRGRVRTADLEAAKAAGYKVIVE